METEIKALIESSKIGKLLKEKLIAFGFKKDNEFNSLQADICRLKTEYNEKSKSIEKSIVEIQNDDKYVMFSNRVISLEEKITELQRSFFEFKTEFSSKFENFESKFSTYADAMETMKPKDFFFKINTKINSFEATYADIVKNKPVEVLTDIKSKLDVVKDKIDADNEQKQIEKKRLNIIVFNIPENKGVPLQGQFDSCKKDFKVLQEVLGENKIEKHELKTLYRIGKYENGKVRPIIVKLSDTKAKERLIKLRNLKYVTHEFEVKIYINQDRTIEQLKMFKKLREELERKQAMAEQNNLNIKYVIKNNKIVEATNHLFRYDTQKLWD